MKRLTPREIEQCHARSQRQFSKAQVAKLGIIELCDPIYPRTKKFARRIRLAMIWCRAQSFSKFTIQTVNKLIERYYV